MNKHSKNLLIDLITLLSGMALTLAFAPYEIFPIAILAPAILFTVWQRQSPKRAFWLGFVFGYGLFGAGVYWIFISIHFFGDVPTWLSLIITGGMIAILSAEVGFVGYLCNRYYPEDNTLKLTLVMPAIWVAIEWVRCWFLSGFPWLLIGYSQTNSPLKGYAPIFSVFGVSLAALITSGLVVAAIKFGKARLFRQLYFCLFAIASIWIVGSMLNLLSWTSPAGKPVTVSLVQGNIPQSIKWDPEHLTLSLKRYTELSKPLWGKSQIIIWPEAAVPIALQDAADFINALDARARQDHTAMILGIPIKDRHSDNYFNAVVTLGATRQVYLKRHLVPFGEYTPFSYLFARLLNFMDVPMSDLIAGAVKQEPLLVSGVKILTAICYEIAFPELMNTNDPSIGMILTVTNDAWFGRSNAQAQHLQMAQMRSIELRRPSVLISNDGITAIMDAFGNIVESAPPHEVAVLTGVIRPTMGATFWMVNGLDPIIIVVIAILFFSKRAKKWHKIRNKNIITKPNELELSKIKE